MVEAGVSQRLGYSIQFRIYGFPRRVFRYPLNVFNREGLQVNACFRGNILNNFILFFDVSQVDYHLIIRATAGTIGNNVFDKSFCFVKINTVAENLNKSFLSSHNGVESVIVPFCQVSGN